MISFLLKEIIESSLSIENSIKSFEKNFVSMATSNNFGCLSSPVVTNNTPIQQHSTVIK
jgi:hypothetical protein